MNKWKRILLQSTILGIIAGGSIYLHQHEVEAETFHENENQEFDFDQNKINRGASYWTTSIPREFLNSAESDVEYTNMRNGGIINHNQLLGPGFLYDFTDEEIEDIAVTRRRAFLHGNIQREFADELGNNPRHSSSGVTHNTPFMHLVAMNPLDEYNNLTHKATNDKVFFLNSAEYQQYIQQRQFSWETTDGESWYIQGPRTTAGNISTYAVGSHGPTAIGYLNRSDIGYRPALH